MPQLILKSANHPLGSSIGGAPLAPLNTIWPICRQCSEPMQFLAQLPLAETGVPEFTAREQMILLFQCQNKPGLCSEWGADDGGNAALLVPIKGRQELAAPPGETLLPEKTGMKFESWLEPADPDEAHELYLDTLVDKGGLMLGKIGGEPVWWQFDQTPNCTCSYRMRFIGQIEESQEYMNFGGGGVGYAFACTICPASAKFLWQC